MTHTFDAKSYTDLLVRYQPKPILTEAENEAAIALAQELEHRPQRSTEEEVFLDLLITLIEKFESEHYPIPEGNGSSIMQHLIEARELTETDLIPVLGTQTAVTEILARQRAIKPDEAAKLAEFFHVDATLFTYSNPI
ncbi:helix-turn-helix domain-containing protein [Leptolyngbya sp. AN03gr2]|uniref:helix-turn-helix domain-containing protein n=1 Tax=unclassified Leptolyngbya TaxID=2650499 RepID=UPI003D3119E7